MAVADRSAADVVAALQRFQTDAELANIRKRLAPDEEAFGMRMRDLFDVAKAHTDLALAEVDRLLDHPATGWRGCHDYPNVGLPSPPGLVAGYARPWC